MQSRGYAVVSLILSILGILFQIASYLNIFIGYSLYAAITGLIISIVSLVLSVKGIKIVKNPVGVISFIFSVIGIIIAILLLLQWAACATLDFIESSSAIGTGVFDKFF